jgi:anti-sigma factor RsiW
MNDRVGRLRWWRRDEVACQQFVELVTDYLEGALPRALQGAVERHLSACADCRAYLDQLEATLAVAGRLRPEDLPDDVVEAVLRAFDET